MALCLRRKVYPALAITPFLARYFKLRNDALLAASMGLEEYCYIYAVAYHDLLLADSTRREIFSDNVPLSPEASEVRVAPSPLRLNRFSEYRHHEHFGTR